MRPILSTAVVLALSFVGSSLFAEEGSKPVNTVCPESGDKIDLAVKPYAVKTKDGSTVLIGVCCKMCIDDIKKNPEKYAAAAKADKKAAP